MERGGLACLENIFLTAIAALFISGDCCFAGDNQKDLSTTVGKFQNAAVFTVDPPGNFFVIDAGTNEVVKCEITGKQHTIGGYGWTDLAFDRPVDLIAPNGLDLYVADYGNHRIQRFDRNLNFVSTLYTRDDDDPDQRFGYPRSVAMDRFGALYIVDGENTRVLKIDASNVVERNFGGQEAGKGRLHSPSRIRVTPGDLVYVQDGNSIVVFDVFGNYVRTFGDGLFGDLQTFSLDGSTLYVLDSCTVRIISDKGEMMSSRTLIPDSPGGDCGIRDLAVQGKKIFILMPQRILIYDASDFFEGREEN